MMAAGSAVECRQRALEVVHDRQPFPGHRGPGLRLGPADLGGAALAQVVEIGQGPEAQVLQLSDPVQQIGDRGLVTSDITRAVGLPVLPGILCLAGRGPPGIPLLAAGGGAGIGRLAGRGSGGRLAPGAAAARPLTHGLPHSWAVNSASMTSSSSPRGGSSGSGSGAGPCGGAARIW